LNSELQNWLEAADFGKVIEAAAESHRTVGALINLTYSADPLVAWRAIDAVGRCASRIPPIRTEILVKYLRRLFWMMSDESGSSSPHAPELIGEIIRSNPSAFAGFIPLAIALLDLEPEDRPRFLPGILYALGRIGEVSPGSLEESLPSIEQCLADPDPQVRTMAVWCMGRIGHVASLLRYPELLRDTGTARIYRGETILETSAGSLFSEETGPPA
jgi:hypothetical protein